MALDLKESNFNTEVLQSALPVLVDFWAPWCGPCRSMAPVIEELADEYGGRVKVAKVNVDENKTLAGSYGVMSIPTLIIFNNGKIVDTIVGFNPKTTLAKKLDKLIEG
ncbi:MAG: thioredoxin [Peptococcaceae bacterium]|nr:MAG: thioredoxin [Peptococcaceae bacterium]